MLQLLNIVKDRGSKYAVSGGSVHSKQDIDVFLLKLKSNKKFAKATHNTWAAILSDSGPIKNDDGESGAAAIILKMLERQKLFNHIVVVTRWYGGVHLGGDRFTHVVSSTREYFSALENNI